MAENGPDVLMLTVCMRPVQDFLFRSPEGRTCQYHAERGNYLKEGWTILSKKEHFARIHFELECDYLNFQTAKSTEIRADLLNKGLKQGSMKYHDYT